MTKYYEDMGGIYRTHLEDGFCVKDFNGKISSQETLCYIPVCGCKTLQLIGEKYEI